MANNGGFDRGGGAARLRRRLDELAAELAVLAAAAPDDPSSRDAYERAVAELDAVARQLRAKGGAERGGSDPSLS